MSRTGKERAPVVKNEGRKKNGRGRAVRTRVMFALFVAAIMLLPLPMFQSDLDTAIVTDQNTGIEYHDITYHYDSSESSASKAVTIRYYGIAATEYNPEVWGSSLTSLGADLVSIGGNTVNAGNPVTNWVGPTVSNVPIATKVHLENIFSVYYDTANSKYVLRDNTNGSWKYIDLTKDTITITVNASSVLDGTDSAIYSTCGSEKNEDRFYYGNENTRFKVTYTTKYNANDNKLVITGKCAKMGSFYEGSTMRITDSLGTTQAKVDLYYYSILNDSAKISTNKVFGGWEYYRNNEPVMVYPGDVVPNDVTDLYAIWIMPDILAEGGVEYVGRINDVGSSESFVSTISTATKTETTLTYQSYIDVSDITSVNYSDRYRYISSGYYLDPSPSSNSMFATVHHLTQDCSSPNSELLLNGGTYRSSDISDPSTLEINASIKMGGNVVIDCLELEQNVVASNRKAENANNSINANNHRLIIGTGVVCTYGEFGNADGNEVFQNNLLAAPAVFGGTANYNGNINSSVPVEQNKAVVSYSNTGLSNVTVNIATFVIVHSGTYSHLVAGSPASTIGSSTNPMSTYMVIKGAVVLGTVSGASGSASVVGANPVNRTTECQGGTFIYMYGLNALGDRYEDMATGHDHPTDLAIDESTIIQGGSYSKNITGSTHLFITGKSSVFDVQGGGRSGSSHVDYAYLEITGKAEVRHVACGTVTDALNNNDTAKDVAGGVKILVDGNPHIATLLGAGYDTYSANTSTASMKKGTIDIEIRNGTLGYVYGGGMRGTIGTTESRDGDNRVNIKITMTGGTVEYDLYGGGRGGLDKIHHKARDEYKVTIDNPDGSVGRWDTGNLKNLGNNNTTGSSIVYGDIEIVVTGGTVGNIYGGGESMPATKYYLTNPKNNNECILTNEYKNGIAPVDNVAAVFGDVTVKVGGSAYIVGDVYGGGRGIDPTKLSADTVQYVKVNAYNMSCISWSGGKDCYIPYCSSTLIYAHGEFRNIPWACNANPYYVDSDDGNERRGIVTFYASNSNENVDASSSCKYVNYAAVYGKTTVIIGGQTVSESNLDIDGTVYGGGALGVVKEDTNGVGGSTLVDIRAGNIDGYVYGGGLGREGIEAVSKNRSVYISGGANIVSSVYGGSSIGNDGSESEFNDDKKSSSKVVVSSATIGQSIFGGGLMGDTWGNTAIYVGYEYNKETYVTTPSRDVNTSKVTVTNIFAGGNVKPTSSGDDDDDDEDAFERILVHGDGYIEVNGDGKRGKITITGSIMGSGNSCRTGGNRVVFINELDNPEEMTALHRMDELTIAKSTIQISGRNSATEVAGAPSKILSVFNIGKLILENGTVLKINYPMDYIYEYHSVDINGKDTLESNPLNNIVFLRGSTFYVRSETANSLDYGPVTGYTLLTVDNQSTYGGFVMGSEDDSTGGFVVVKNGSYKLADEAIQEMEGEDIVCWYLAGIERKALTMTLNASETYNEDTEKYESVWVSSEESLVNILRFDPSASLVYSGGVFTSVSTDSSGNDYEFTRPGTETAKNQFGLIIGCPSQTDLYALTVDNEHRHYLTLGDSPSSWINCTYFDESDTYSLEPTVGSETGSFNRVVDLTPVSLSNGISALSSNLCLKFTGIPENTQAYLGYVTLYFQEVTEVEYEVKVGDDFVKSTEYRVSNNIEVRVDLYVYGVHMNQVYDVTLKTKNETGVPGNDHGYVDIMIPAGAYSGRLELTNVSTTNMESGSKLLVTAVSNVDNTPAWITSGISATYEEGKSFTSQHVGTMLGSYPATVRYEVKDFAYPAGLAEDQHPKIVMSFTLTDKDGNVTPSTITITVKRSDPIQVTFIDDYRGERTVGVVNGDYLTMADTPVVSENFVGWYLDNQFRNQYDFSNPVTKPFTLYARYSFIVTFDDMNGSTSRLYISTGDRAALLDETTVKEPQRDGYKFVGWYKDKSYLTPWVFSYDTVVSDITLYAKWEGKQVKVEFYSYDESNGWEKFTGANIDTKGEYIMKKESGQYIYPMVSYGSTFSIVEPAQSNKSVLKYVADTLYPGAGDFVRWEAYSSGSPDNGGTVFMIYEDTILTTNHVSPNETSTFPKNDSGGMYTMPVIKLYAHTSPLGVRINMVDTTGDESVTINSPKERYVYPTSPTFTQDPNDPSIWYADGDTTVQYTRTDSPAVTYKDSSSGIWYVYDSHSGYYLRYEDGSHLTVIEDGGDTIMYSDKYGNVYDDTRTIVGGIIYYVDQGVEKRCIIEYDEQGNPTYYEYDEKSGEKGTKMADKPAFSYYKDVYSNHYEYDNGAYTLMQGSEYYFIFDFELNKASRPGYKHYGWHNEHVDDKHSLVPSAGTKRTIYLFVKDEAGCSVVDKEVRVVKSESNVDYYTTIDYNYVNEQDPDYQYVNNNSYFPRIDYSDRPYTIEYKAEWKELYYTVKISDSAHGTIDAYVVHSDTGNQEYIGDGYATVMYGDRIKLVYTPNGDYVFQNWSIAGEHYISDADKTNREAILVVQGDCTVMANDAGDKLVTLNVIYDNAEHDTEASYIADRSYTKLLMHDKVTGEDYEFRYDADESINVTGQLYKGYVPFGNNYEILMVYDENNDGVKGLQDDTYHVVGDITVSAYSQSNIKVWVISARLVEGYITIPGVDEPVLPDESDYVDGSVLFLSKYVAVTDEVREAYKTAHGNYSTNDPGSGHPPVKITIAEGYKYGTYEGFPDQVDGEWKFVRVEGNIYGVDSEEESIGGSVTKEFHLNWIKVDKPAEVVVKTEAITRSIQFSAEYDNDGNDDNGKYTYITEVTEITFGQSLGISAQSSALLTDLSNTEYSGVSIQGWYLESTFDTLVTDSSVLDSDVLTALGDGTTIYAKLVAGDVLSIPVGYKEQGLDGEYPDTSTSMTTFNIVTNAGTYTGTLTIAPKAGFTPSVEFLHSGTLDNSTVCTINGTELTASVVTEDKDKITGILIKYARNEVNVKTVPNGGELSSGEAINGSYMVGETIVLPVYAKDGKVATGWTSSTGGTVTIDGDRFIYVVEPSNATIALTPNYPASTVVVTFLTPTGVFSNGSQRMVETIAKGSTLNSADYVPDAGDAYTFVSFDNWPVNNTFNEDTTVQAKWTVSKHLFRFSASSDVTVSAKRDSYQTPLVALATTGYDHNSLITMTLTPAVGKSIDFENSMQLAFTKVWGVEDNEEIREEYRLICGVLYHKPGNKWVEVEDQDTPYFFKNGGNYIQKTNDYTLYNVLPNVSINREMVDEDGDGVGDYYLDNYGNYWKPWTYDIEELSGDKGYKLTFYLTESMEVRIVTKAPSVSIKFVVDDVLSETVSVPKYSTYTFYNYQVGGVYSQAYWYTDRTYDSGKEFPNSPDNDKVAVYSYVADKDLTLYTYYAEPVINTYDYDGNKKVRLKATVDNGEFDLPTRILTKDGYTFVGWAVHDSKNTYTYIPNQSIAASPGQRLELYAYYLTDGNASAVVYDGNNHYSTGITDALGDYQVLLGDNLTVYYAKEDWTVGNNQGKADDYLDNSLAFKNADEYDGASQNRIYYHVVITIGVTDYEAYQGYCRVPIAQRVAYVIAPTDYKKYNGEALAIVNDDVELIGFLDDEVSSKQLVEDSTHGKTITNVGYLKTTATVTLVNSCPATNYKILTIDGFLSVYRDDAATCESRGSS